MAVALVIIIIPLSLFSMSASLKGKRSKETLEIIFSKIGFIVSIVDIIGTIVIVVIGVILNK